MDFLFRSAQGQSVVLWLHLSTMNGNVLHSKWGGGASLTLLRLLGSPQEDQHLRETDSRPGGAQETGGSFSLFPLGREGLQFPLVTALPGRNEVSTSASLLQ